MRKGITELASGSVIVDDLWIRRHPVAATRYPLFDLPMCLNSADAD